MPEQSQARAELATALEDRRAYLRVKWKDVADRADISVPTLNRARNTDYPLTADVKNGIEDALDLDRGAIDRKLAGGPLVLDTTPDAADTDLYTLTPEEEAKIHAMSMQELLDVGGELLKTNELASILWLRVALRVKMHGAQHPTR